MSFFFVSSRKWSLDSYTFFCILNLLHIPISNTLHVCILLALQPHFPVPPNATLSTPHFPQEPARVPSVPPSNLSLSSVVPAAPWLAPHFFPALRSVTMVKSYPCIHRQASCFWQRWTLLSFLWQAVTRPLSSTQMSSLVKTDQGGAKNKVGIWERTIVQERRVSLDEVLASAFCWGQRWFLSLGPSSASKLQRPTNRKTTKRVLAPATWRLAPWSPLAPGPQCQQIQGTPAAAGGIQGFSPGVLIDSLEPL